MKKVILAVMVFFTQFFLWSTVALPAFADDICNESDAQYEMRMTYISSYSCNLDIDSSGVASLFGSLKGKPGVNNAYVKVTLQKKVANIWVNISAWEDMGGRTATVNETYSVSHGTYRIHFQGSAGNESVEDYSSNKTY